MFKEAFESICAGGAMPTMIISKPDFLPGPKDSDQCQPLIAVLSFAGVAAADSNLLSNGYKSNLDRRKSQNPA